MAISEDIKRILRTLNITTWDDNLTMTLGPGPNIYQDRLTIDGTEFNVNKPVPPALRAKIRSAVGIYRKKRTRELPDFYHRLERFGKISIADVVYYEGLYYGYPKCCVKHYVYCTFKLRVPPNLYMVANYGTDKSNYGYVQCPKCLMESRMPPKITVQTDVNPLDFFPRAIGPDGQPDEDLMIARIFCHEKTWRTCKFRESCVDGKETVWVPCPSVQKNKHGYEVSQAVHESKTATIQ